MLAMFSQAPGVDEDDIYVNYDKPVKELPDEMM